MNLKEIKKSITDGCIVGTIGTASGYAYIEGSPLSYIDPAPLKEEVPRERSVATAPRGRAGGGDLVLVPC